MSLGRPDVLGQRRVQVDLVGGDADVVGELLQRVLVHEQLVELPLYFARASSSVSPMIGTMPGRIFTCSGLRPAAAGADLSSR